MNTKLVRIEERIRSSDVALRVSFVSRRISAPPPAPTPVCKGKLSPVHPNFMELQSQSLTILRTNNPLLSEPPSALTLTIEASIEIVAQLSRIEIYFYNTDRVATVQRCNHCGVKIIGLAVAYTYLFRHNFRQI